MTPCPCFHCHSLDPGLYFGGPRIWDVGTSHRPLDLLNCRVRPIIAVGVLGPELVTDQNILALKPKGP